MMHNTSQVKVVTVSPSKGFSLVEMLVVIGILGIIGLALSNFQVDVWRQNAAQQSALEAEGELRNTLRQFMHDVRGASQSNTGSYAVELASNTALTIYSDVDGDVNRERVRYRLVNGTVTRGTTKPSGSPASYLDVNETTKTMVHSVVAATTRFDYFDGSYMGTTSPLSIPVDSSRVRFIRFTIAVDKNPSLPPATITMTGSAAVRSLKDNF